MLVLRHNRRSTMKKKHHTPEQIVAKLRQVEALTAEGATVAEAAKHVGVSEQSIYRWKKQYGQMDRDEVKRLKALEAVLDFRRHAEA